MCAYNKINGEYACGNDTLLNTQIKDAIGFKGFIMSDWKAVYGWDFALKGLDQHSGAHTIALGKSSEDFVLTGSPTLHGRLFGR